MKKRAVYFIFLFYVLTNTTYSQGGDFLWAQSIGDISADRVVGEGVITDDAGNIYSVGILRGSADFDPGPGVFNLSAPNGHAFVQKVDSDGNFIWAKIIEGTNMYGFYDIGVDDAGNVHVSGTFLNSGDFDPGPGVFTLTANGNYDAFILKLDVNGDFLWAKSIGGTYPESCNSHVIDHAGNVYLTGRYFASVDFDPGPGVYNLTASTNGYAYVLKLDSNGDFVWAKSMEGSASSTVIGKDIKIDGPGNAYIVGDFDGTVDFDPGVGVVNLISNGDSEIFIQKLDVDGNLVWVKAIGGSGGDQGSSIALDASTNVIISGQFQHQVDFDPGPNDFMLDTSPSNYGGYVLKLDSAGNFGWAKGLLTPGSGTIIDYDLVTDASNNIFALGWFDNSFDFDPGSGSHIVNSTGGAIDAYLLKLDSLGNFVWVNVLAGTGREYFAEGAIDQQGNIISTGGFELTVDFDPGPNTHDLTSSGDYNFFLLKLSGCATSVGIAENDATQPIVAYPNPTSGVVTIDLEDIQDVTIKVLNMNGQVVYQQAQVNGMHQFELTAAPGVYTIEVSTATIRKYVKLVKQ